MTFMWRIVSQSSAVIEGALDITVHDGAEVLGRAVVDDVVISNGEQLLRTVLPAIESNNQLNSLDLRVELVSKRQLLGKWEFTLRAPSQWQRSFVLLLCDPWQTNLPTDVRGLVDRLRIETWNADPADRTITTIPAHVRPDDLPADPLGYCGFDVAILAHEGLAELKEGQLRTLMEWVEAGGSLCVVPGRGVLKDYHAKLLNQGVRSRSEEAPLALDPAGRLLPPAEGDNQAGAPLVRHYGLGRIAVVRGKLDQLLADREGDVRTMLAFLWKLRKERVTEFVETGKFLVKKVTLEPDKPSETENQYQAANRYNVSYAELRPQDKQLAPLPLQSGDQLLSRLMPEGLKVVPLSLIGIILVVYVVLIGPGDWFVLGAIKRRKWTWFTFPFVTVALTLFTVWLAEWYMQVTDRRRVVTFHDVGAEGRVARRNRFEVLFQGSEREVRTELTREILSALALQRFSSALWYSNQQAQMQGVDQRRRFTGVPSYIGRVPGHYEVRQYISQWTPQLNRRFSIAHGTDRPAEFDWDKFADKATFTPDKLAAGPTRDELVKALKAAFGDSIHVAIMTKGKQEFLAGTFGFFVGGTVYGVDAYGNQLAQPAYYPAGYNPNGNVKQTGFLEDVCRNELGGLFKVVSQLSPSGGKDFEDMALVDPTDPAQWLLVVAVERGDEVDLYRKLYTGED